MNMRNYYKVEENQDKAKKYNYKKGVKKYVFMMLLVALCVPCMGAYASEIEAQFSSLQSIVATIISAIGQIITLWGISEFGISFQSNDGASQSYAFKRIAGGIIMILAPNILISLT